MSLILEALRKSEAERRRGQAPGLFTPDTGMLAPVRKEKSPALVLAIAIVILAGLAWAGWHWPPPSVEPTGAAPLARSTAPAPTTVVTDASPQASPEPRVQEKTTRPAVTPPASMPAHAAPSRAEPSVALMPFAGAPALATPPLATSSEPAMQTLAALAADRRSDLPALKLSMHVYNDAPEKRFAIIDGQRVAEGASLGPAIVLSIRRDGVVLGIDGQSYLLPRP